jgi:hypothetical protein
LEAKQLKADTEEIERDASMAAGDAPVDGTAT